MLSFMLAKSAVGLLLAALFVVVLVQLLRRRPAEPARTISVEEIRQRLEHVKSEYQGADREASIGRSTASYRRCGRNTGNRSAPWMPSSCYGRFHFHPAGSSRPFWRRDLLRAGRSPPTPALLSSTWKPRLTE